MALSYFPIFSYKVEDSENYSIAWPLEEIQFEKRYSQRLSRGYKIRIWNVRFRLFDTFKGFTIPAWTSGAYTIGNYVHPVTPNNFVYMCVDPGTSDIAEPSWPTTQGETVADGGVIWVCFKNSQIEAFFTFLDDRQGRAEPFKVYMPLFADWVTCVFPEEPLINTPVKPGYFGVIDVDVKFEEDYSDAP